MIGISEEYKAMYEVETRLWWYKILHKRVLGVLKTHFSTNTVSILDAGCGTGGLMSFLQNAGYQNIKGFDLSSDAVAFAQSRSLEVDCLDLLDIQLYKPDQQFDLIVCNDVICYLDDAQIIEVFKQFRAKLKPNGLIISNNNALKAFEGLHSKVLKINRRFNAKELTTLAQQADFKVEAQVYWPFLLSPLIWIYRKCQLLGISLGLINVETAKSDVVLPDDFQNNLFYQLSNFEQTIFKKPPFGSSIFVVMKPL